MDETSDDSSSVASDNGAASTRDREGWLRWAWPGLLCHLTHDT